MTASDYLEVLETIAPFIPRGANDMLLRLALKSSFGKVLFSLGEFAA